VIPYAISNGTLASSSNYAIHFTTSTLRITPATPMVSVNAPGGVYTRSPIAARATVTGASGTAAASLEGVTPTLTYYVGSGTSGTDLGAAAPSAVGTYTVVASFPGSADYAPIRSAPTTFVIAPSRARIALKSSASTAVYGQDVTFVATASSSAGTPSGTVTFFDGATPVGTVPLDNAGNATLTSSVLAVGSHSITAAYNGTADFSSVESGSASESVAQAGTHVVLVPHSVFRKKRLVSVDFTAEIEPLAPGGGVPTGRVAFELLTRSGKKIHTQMLGNVAVAGGQAALLVKASSVLNKSISIVYGGDADFGPSTVTSPRLTQEGLK